MDSLQSFTLPQIQWLDKEGAEIEKNEKKKNIVDEEEEVEGTKLHNAVSSIKLKVKMENAEQSENK